MNSCTVLTTHFVVDFINYTYSNNLELLWPMTKTHKTKTETNAMLNKVIIYILCTTDANGNNSRLIVTWAFHIIHATWAICYTYHTVLKASPDTTKPPTTPTMVSGSPLIRWIVIGHSSTLLE